MIDVATGVLLLLEYALLYLGLLNTVVGAAVPGSLDADVKITVGCLLLAVWGVLFL